MRRWFLPELPDVLGVLGEQMRITLQGMEAFVAWSKGDAEASRALRRAEHEADEARRAVQASLRQAFTTPIGPEDVYELSERLDAVLNGAKNLVREAELLDISPDEPMITMTATIEAGVAHLADAFSALGTKSAAVEATAAADRSIREQRGLERCYRSAMSSLLELEDFREVTAKRELYRRYARLGDRVEEVASRVWYAVVKLG